MTKIKLCGLSRPCDIETVNVLMPDYIGFVFAPKSRRYVSYEKAAMLKRQLNPAIAAVGVFVDEAPETVARLLHRGVIDIVQLHGTEDEDYIKFLRTLTDKPIIKAFRMETRAELSKAESSSADAILLDSGAGTGIPFDWTLIADVRRPYFLAGGISPENAGAAVRALRPYAVDVSSGIETDGVKDKIKMAALVQTVRKEDKL